ncbi:uncharacterized protein LOC124916057 [Impatiens glandulifera]|uniref:uncharacterized protein LOC124916057 n=1 Tax=Impatiens glandulifera TaxID=253017 RepID=UPI001FB0C583|nr:uncharacterized protein LOC124916057 [Impatiens glandulifera]
MKSHSSTLLSFTTGETQIITTSLPNYNSSLHSVRKPPPKITKKPIAPIPPTPPRVYNVNPLHFKQLVQKLTAEPEFQSSRRRRRLHKLAPPPLALDKSTDHVPPPEQDHDLLNYVKTIQSPSLWNTCSAAESTFEMKNSPAGWFGMSSPLWSSFPALSPGMFSAFEMNTSNSFSLQVFPDL